MNLTNLIHLTNLTHLTNHSDPISFLHTPRSICYNVAQLPSSIMQTPRLRHSAVFLVLFGMLIGIAGTSVGADILGSAIFPDVRRGTYYDEAVGELNQLGIINGYADGRFGPNDYVTRGQVAVLMQRLRDELTGSNAVQSSSSSSSTSSTSSSSSSTSSSSSSSSSSITSAGTVRFTIATYSIDEDEGHATISVVRIGGNQGNVSVQYTMSGGTATASDDFEVSTGTISFADGETSRTFSVRIYEDELDEGDETITLELTSPSSNTSLTTPSTATLTIKDNDGSSTVEEIGDNVLNLSAVGYDVAEDSGELTVTVMRENPTGTASVQYTTQDGSAEAGDDYTAETGTLDFGEGETEKTVTVTIESNEIIDGNRMFSFILRVPSASAVLGNAEQADIIIIDDDVGTFGAGSLKFTLSHFTVLESVGVAHVPVSRIGGTEGTVTVDYATTGGTAVAGSDYTATSGTITFAPGESKKTFGIEIEDDSTNDSGEYINVQISNATGGAGLSSPTTTTLEIQ